MYFLQITFLDEKCKVASKLRLVDAIPGWSDTQSMTQTLTIVVIYVCIYL